MTPAQLSESLTNLAKRFQQNNPTDQEISVLRRIAQMVGEIECKGSCEPMVTFYAGYTAGYNDHRNNRGMLNHEAWTQYSHALDVLDDPKPAMIDVRDTDTGAILSGVPIAKKMSSYEETGTLRSALRAVTTPAPPISHTDFYKLVDRVAKLEAEINRPHANVQQRIIDRRDFDRIE